MDFAEGTHLRHARGCRLGGDIWCVKEDWRALKKKLFIRAAC